MRLRSLSLFVVFHAVSDGSSYSNIEAIVNLNLLSAMTAALVRSMNDDLLNKLVHYLRRKLCDMLILLYCFDESCHIG